jgi:hypothetical protein
MAALRHFARARSRTCVVARRLLVPRRMTKLLVSSLALVATLCGPALADPVPTAMKFKVTVSDGADLRTYELALLSDSCGSVEDHAGDRIDEVKLCARDAAAGTRLGAHWKLRSKNVEHMIDFEAVVAKGKSVDVGRDKGPRLTVTLI